MKALLVVVFLVGLAFAINEIDVDGDGFFSDAERGEYQDCCDTVDDGCYDPYMVNPGAWEVPNNGQADRCIQGLDAIPTNVPCDWRFTNTTPSLQPIEGQNPPAAGYINAMINPNPTQSQSEPGIVAMDICEFKDDDDDPSWGFCRQENLVFALADETRNGFDIGIVGPSPYQASVLSTFGHIEPVNGDYFLAISTGQAFDNAYAPLDRNTNWVSTVVEALPEWRRSGTFTGPCETAATRANAAQVFDSILARFCMQQPTNMNAFSLKVMYLDLEMTPNGIQTTNANTCTPGTLTESWLIITKNDTVGTPLDKNIAFDKHGNNIWSYNKNLDFYEQCVANPPTSWPNNVCPIDPYYLENTGYVPTGAATQWIPVGTAATPGHPFQLKMATWDSFDTNRDNVVLFDDFIPVAEARTQGNPWGYQWTSDLGLERLKPTRSGFYPAGTTSITFDYLLKNYGPEQTSDVYVSFTPPKGTFYQSVSGGVGAPTVRTALAPYQDNSFYKYKAAQTLGVGETVTGSITFGVHPDSPPDLQFRVTTTCASIEKDFGNNYQTRDIFIDKL